MSRSKTDSPAYQFHVSGQARVEFTIGGKRVTKYLGVFGSPESYAKYAWLLARYQAGESLDDEPDQQADEHGRLCAGLVEALDDPGDAGLHETDRRRPRGERQQDRGCSRGLP